MKAIVDRNGLWTEGLARLRAELALPASYSADAQPEAERSVHRAADQGEAWTRGTARINLLSLPVISPVAAPGRQAGDRLQARLVRADASRRPVVSGP